MLILTRKIDEAIVIGSNEQSQHLVRITVLRIENGKVRLGFDAGPSVHVHRSEVWQKIHGHTATGETTKVDDSTPLQ